MKIAIPYENGQVFQHFGHSEQFKLYVVNEDEILSSEIVDTNGSGHGALAGFLKEHGVNTLICGGIGAGAVGALNEMGIQILGGASGEADQQVIDFLNGKLHFNSGATCDHHHDGEEGCEHECDGNVSACGEWCHS